MTSITVDDVVQQRQRHQNNRAAMNISYALAHFALQGKMILTPQDFEAILPHKGCSLQRDAYEQLQKALDNNYSWRSQGPTLDIYDPCGEVISRVICPSELLKRQ